MKRILIALLMMCSMSYGQTMLRNLIITDPTNSTYQARVNSDGQLHVVLESMPDANNTTTNALSGGSTFTGSATSLRPYNGISLHVSTDSPSATKGLSIEYSADGTTWYNGESYTIPQGASKFYTPPAWLEYFRVVYSNGSTAQTNFSLHTQLHKGIMKWSSHNVDSEIADEDDAELGISVIHAKNPAGVYGPIQRSTDGNLLIHDAENPSAIAFGSVPGKSIIQKFGNAPDFDSTDGQITIWDGADDAVLDEMQYNYSATNLIDSVISSSTLDLQDVEIQGLDGDGYLVIQTNTLSGQTRVALSTPLWRTFRTKNINNSDFVGNVCTYETNAPTTAGVVDDSSLVRSCVDNGNNQTEMGIFTVPKGKEIVIKSVYWGSAGANKSASYEITLWARPYGGVFQLKYKNAINDDVYPNHEKPYATGLYFDELTDIEVRVQCLTISPTIIGATISGGFEIEMQDKE